MSEIIDGGYGSYEFALKAGNIIRYYDIIAFNEEQATQIAEKEFNDKHNCKSESKIKNVTGLPLIKMG